MSPSQRARLSVARQPSARSQPLRQSDAPAVATAQRHRTGCVSVFIACTLGLALIVFLMFMQVQIAQVMIYGVKTEGIVESAPWCARAGTHLTLRFADRNGHIYTVYHLTYAGCFDHYHVGDEIPLRYVPDNPTNLLIQPEIDFLPLALIFPFGVADIIFIGGPFVLLIGLRRDWAPGLIARLSWLGRRLPSRGSLPT